jgi:hypothetical protein
MRTEQIAIYNFNELSDSAKDNARNWFRSCQDSVDFEDTTEFAREIVTALGVDVDNIFWSGFCSQGDGACFTGRYSYTKNWKNDLKAIVGGELHGKFQAIGNALQSLQKANFYQIEANITHNARYYHQYSTDIEVTRHSDTSIVQDAEQGIKEYLQSAMGLIYDMLDDQNDYITSNDYIDECISTNNYEFYANGDIV